VIHILISAVRIAIKLRMAAERRQQEKAQAKYERLEAVREASDPDYRAYKEALRLAAAEAAAKAKRRATTLMLFNVLLWLLWLGSSLGIVINYSSSTETVWFSQTVFGLCYWMMSPIISNKDVGKTLRRVCWMSGSTSVICFMMKVDGASSTLETSPSHWALIGAWGGLALWLLVRKFGSRFEENV
jgi:hypothetical protein